MGGSRRLAVVALLALVAAVALGSLALAATNTISTVAGTGTAGFNGDGVAATSAQLNFPVGVTATQDGGYYIADQVNWRVRRVDPSGNISTVAGSGTQGFGGDSGPALSANLNAPSGIGVLPDGSVLIADANNNRVRKVAPGFNGTITTDAGGGGSNPGDGGPATSAQLAFPFDIAVVDQNTYLIADEDHHRIRRVASGNISTIAGDGTQSFGGDNGTATSAQLNKPSGVAVTIDGAVLIADQFNNRIRRVSATTGGTITTVAGTGTAGYNGDGIQASTAQLNHPTHVTALPDGGYLIADKDNHRLRHVAADGTISTVAGTGTAGYNGDGIEASSAQLNTPTGAALTVNNDFLIADAFNHRIRRVAPAPPPPQPPGQPAAPQNINRPTISALISAGGPTGSYFCNPGTWRNLPSSGFTYRWVAVENGQAVPLAFTQQFTPSPDVYGFPITCEATVQGPTGPVTATSNSAFFTTAGMNTLPPTYGDVEIRGIDVFQVVQPNDGATQFEWPSGAFGITCGGGTPTAWRQPFAGNPNCELQGRDPQKTDYDGVKPLDSDKVATAIVYVDVNQANAADPNLRFDVELSGTLNGQSLGDPLVLNTANPPFGFPPTVERYERSGSQYGLKFQLPSSWTAPGNLQLTAHVRFPNGDFGPNFGVRQCDDPSKLPGGDQWELFRQVNCNADDTFVLSGIPFQHFLDHPLYFKTMALLQNGQSRFTRTPDQVMAAAKWLYPGGARMSFGDYTMDMNIDAESRVVRVTQDASGNCVPSAALVFGGFCFVGTCFGTGAVGTAPEFQGNRICRWNAIDAKLMRWITDNPARPLVCFRRGVCVRLRDYDAVVGISNYASGSKIAGVDDALEPGWEHPAPEKGATSVPASINNVGFNTPTSTKDTGWMVFNQTVHPVQGVAHELGHWLTLPHSGISGVRPSDGSINACGNSDVKESWPPDDIGRLQSARYNPRRGFRATPTVDGWAGATLFELMTYCGDFADRRPATSNNPASSPGNTWLSARNWNRVATMLNFFDFRMNGGFSQFLSRRDASRAAAHTSLGFAVGVASPTSGGISRVVPPDGQDGTPDPDPTSPYKLRSLGAGGQVLLEAGITVSPSEDVQSADGVFAGPVDPNAVAVQLLYNGQVLARKDRSRAPSVKLLAPAKGTRLRTGRSLQVRWTGSDPDGDALEATLDYSADDGASWRTVHTGPNSGRDAVPSSFLASGRHARIRVRLNDGFNEARATSKTFVVDGNPPHVSIIAPTADGPVLAGQRTLLSGLAMDDHGTVLKGKAMTWYAGSKRLGRGANLRVRLAGGKVTVKLLARGSNGLTRAATVRVTVSPRRLRLLSVSVQQRVTTHASTVTVTLKTSARSVLTAAGKRLGVSTKSTKLKIPLPKQPKVGVLRVPFKLTATDRSVKGTIKGAIWVVRT